MERVLISAISALIGFALSQSIPIVRWFLRPRFHLDDCDTGILSSYSGAIPEEDAEVSIGFLLTNKGKSVARGIRVFINQVKVLDRKSAGEDSGVAPFEIAIAQEILLPQRSFTIEIGKFSTSEPFLRPHLKKRAEDYPDFWLLETATRGTRKFLMEVLIITDDPSVYEAHTISVTLTEDELNPVYFDCQDLEP